MHSDCCLFVGQQALGGALSDELLGGVHLHLYIPHMAGFVGILMAAVYYHSVEMWNSPRFLLLLIPYWLSSMIIEVMKTQNLNMRNVSLTYLRPHLTRASIVIYLLLLVIELDILRQLVSDVVFIIEDGMANKHRHMPMTKKVPNRPSVSFIILNFILRMLLFNKMSMFEMYIIWVAHHDQTLEYQKCRSCDCNHARSLYALTRLCMGVSTVFNH